MIPDSSPREDIFPEWNLWLARVRELKERLTDPQVEVLTQFRRFVDSRVDEIVYMGRNSIKLDSDSLRFYVGRWQTETAAIMQAAGQAQVPIELLVHNVIDSLDVNGGIRPQIGGRQYAEEFVYSLNLELLYAE